MTQVEFCRRKGLALSTLTYHLRRERLPGEGGSPGAEGKAVPELFELELPFSTLAGESIVIEVPLREDRGLRIHCRCCQTGEVLRQIHSLLVG